MNYNLLSNYGEDDNLKGTYYEYWPNDAPLNISVRFWWAQRQHFSKKKISFASIFCHMPQISVFTKNSLHCEYFNVNTCLLWAQQWNDKKHYQTEIFPATEKMCSFHIQTTNWRRSLFGVHFLLSTFFIALFRNPFDGLRFWNMQCNTMFHHTVVVAQASACNGMEWVKIWLNLQ